MAKACSPGDWTTLAAPTLSDQKPGWTLDPHRHYSRKRSVSDTHIPDLPIHREGQRGHLGKPRGFQH